MKNNKKEEFLKREGFKRKWLSDKSAYWWEKRMHKNWKICADVGGDFYSSEIKTYKYSYGKWKPSTFETDMYFTSFNKLKKWLES